MELYKRLTVYPRRCPPRLSRSTHAPLGCCVNTVSISPSSIAIAANLDLIVGAAKKFNVPVGQIASQIAGSIEPLRRLAIERMVDESLRRQFRPIEISTCHSVRRRYKSRPATSDGNRMSDAASRR